MELDPLTDDELSQLAEQAGSADRENRGKGRSRQQSHIARGVAIRELYFDTIGEIVSGEDVGRFVEVVDDSQVSGGFLILIYDGIDRSGGAHDHWVESVVDVEQFFDELGWDVRWAPANSEESDAQP